jgi:DNA-binding NarL/FixJ family response regulator
MSIPIHVHVLHAEPIVNTGLCALLQSQPGILVSNHMRAPQQCWAADVLVADYHGGMEIAGQFRSTNRGKPPSLLIVTTYAKQWDLKLALDRGVQGYLLQSCGVDDLADAVRAVHQGRRYLSSELYGHIERNLSFQPLTARESDVLNLLAQGLSNKAIARALKLGEGTVKSYMKGVLSKMGAAARTEALMIANERGLIRRQALALSRC